MLALENLCVMKRQLIDHTYKIGAYTEFIVSEPKRRVVKSGSFRDKVLQHCLCDYVLLPKLKVVSKTHTEWVAKVSWSLQSKRN